MERDNDDDRAPLDRKERRKSQTILKFSRQSGRLETQRPPPNRGPTQRDTLARTAEATLSVLPGLLLTRPDAKPNGFLYDDVTPLDQQFCPNLPKTKIRVINCDSIDAALQLTVGHGPSDKPVCVLNMASATHAGGGFRNGAMAQEEAMCYRSSLAFTLKLRYYPIPERAAIYSPTVIVFRENFANGHQFFDCRDPSWLPVISVVSAAAIKDPQTGCALASPHKDKGEIYSRSSDRDLMAEKMRVILRTAIKNKHRKIVLGAFGCGAFNNPPKEVRRLWEQVLQEPEFSGGWWEDVVFAVLSDPADVPSNFFIFHKTLDGLMV
ncbi:uncharacterized protein Z518_05893 [Rhinocladiella mackenziei CBS 650.93]|uniref:Microbial-type PARG catalytic domain-containing protein n=1 Tax=Rhinocladiella mackenziei CBS 650.93 TaxID=1442369 RepID=A0A0D2IPG3_9EURO|nr:uncharacterized protein Z518_05893 [Rhinocladiella mackenziei CBS 650.93]KIX05021.1 hypothetical protein Z518_05893 [Rhinocladiella mackenziei CBS 650.93]